MRCLALYCMSCWQNHMAREHVHHLHSALVTAPAGLRGADWRIRYQTGILYKSRTLQFGRFTDWMKNVYCAHRQLHLLILPLQVLSSYTPQCVKGSPPCLPPVWRSEYTTGSKCFLSELWLRDCRVCVIKCLFFFFFFFSRLCASGQKRCGWSLATWLTHTTSTSTEIHVSDK